MQVINLVRPVVPQYRTLYADTIQRVTREVGLISLREDDTTVFRQVDSMALYFLNIIPLLKNIIYEHSSSEE